LQQRVSDGNSLNRALATQDQSVDVSWAANFADLKTSAANHDARAVKLADRLHADNREKHQLRAIAINSSNLGIKVLLWEDAERLAAPLVAGI
jgi:hypothetical protein